MDLVHKASPFASWKALDGPLGLVECLPAITGLADDTAELIAPGAFTDSLRIRKPKVVWCHDWAEMIGKSVEAVELLPGHPEIPADLRALGAGCLRLRALLNLDTERGRDAFSDLQFYGAEAGWSIGYQVRPGARSFDTKTGVTTLAALDLYECSPVLFGAMSYARSVSLKAASTPGLGTSWADLVAVLELLSESPSWATVRRIRLAA